MRTGSMTGLVIGLVTDVNDPENQGRVKVSYPWLDDTLNSPWAPVCSHLAGNDRGFYFMPQVDDEVLVGFLHGDFDHPVVLGNLWNGQTATPSPDPRQRMIRSVNGHTIRFVDSTPSGGDLGALIIEDAHGNTITLSNTMITINATAVLRLDAPVVMIANRVVTPSANPI